MAIPDQEQLPVLFNVQFHAMNLEQYKQVRRYIFLLPSPKRRLQREIQRQAMGRGKIEIKKIENRANRQVTFSKRRGGLLKKANELAVLCDAPVGVVIFSSSGKMYDYCSPHLSMRELIEQYQKYTNTRFEDHTNAQQQQTAAMESIRRLRDEHDKLEESIRQFTAAADLTSLDMNSLYQLEKQLEYSLDKVRTRKEQLLNQQMDNFRRKVHILDDQNDYLQRIIYEQKLALDQHHNNNMNVEQKEADQDPVQLYDDQLGHFFADHDSSRNLLQLAPQVQAFRLGQPMQPNLQDLTALQGHNLQLWIQDRPCNSSWE